MDVDALVGALLGSVVGAGIPAAAAYHQLRRARQSTDAEAFGPALLLLSDVQPERVTINVSSDVDVEMAKWAALEQQYIAARQRLLVVSAGHPKAEVRQLAEQADVALANAFISSSWQARDWAQHQGDREELERAKQEHTKAVAALRALVEANFRPWWRR